MASCFYICNGAGGETRTRTPFRILDFESSVSAIPPHRHMICPHALIGPRQSDAREPTNYRSLMMFSQSEPKMRSSTSTARIVVFLSNIFINSFLIIFLYFFGYSLILLFIYSIYWFS